ncbi:MAG: hypothetical protein SGI73_17295, partial [Chloroflexota bacterium]|nr:hypothetical protein [Chloroflexota bacterium]
LSSYEKSFLRAAKVLKKKYRRLDDDLKILTAALKGGEMPGDLVQGLGGKIAYKVRLPNRDAQRGTSGGYRVVYYLQTETVIRLIDIYSKSDRENMTADDIRTLIQEVEPDHDETPPNPDFPTP